MLETIYLTILFVSFSIWAYIMIRNELVYKFISKTNRLIYNYNMLQINTFFEMQHHCIDEGLPLMDQSNIKELEYITSKYYSLVYSFKPLKLKYWLSKEVVEELNKVK